MYTHNVNIKPNLPSSNIKASSGHFIYIVLNEGRQNKLSKKTSVHVGEEWNANQEHFITRSYVT
jgi:hypothetical protein